MDKSIDDYIFDFVYNTAMSDATMQRAYYGSKEDLLQNKEARSIVRDYVDSIMSTGIEKVLMFTRNIK